MTTERGRELEAAATAAPWLPCTWDPMERPHVAPEVEGHPPSADVWRGNNPADAELIAYMRNTYAAALSVVEAAERVAEDDEWDGSDCPWFLGTGICDSGCVSEPACQTNLPNDGWPKQRLRLELEAFKGASNA